MALCFQLVPERLEVVNLAVENDPDALVFVAKGLVAAGNVNDGKPAHAQPDAAAMVLAEVVRTTMGDDAAHGCENRVSGLLWPVEIQDAVDSAHGWSSVSNFFSAMINRYFATVSTRAFSSWLLLPFR